MLFGKIIGQRPTILHKNGVLYWVIQTVDSEGVIADADFDPGVSVLKNNVSVATLTTTRLSTGTYLCSYDPSDEVVGNVFTFIEATEISGEEIQNHFSVTVVDEAGALVALSNAVDNLSAAKNISVEDRSITVE